MGEGKRLVGRGLGWSHTVWSLLFSGTSAHHPKPAARPFQDRTLWTSVEVLTLKGSGLPLCAALGQASGTGNSRMLTHGRHSARAAGTALLWNLP